MYCVVEYGDIAVASSVITSNEQCSQKSAANIGRLREPKHVIYVTVNHIESRSCVIQYLCCCGFFLFCVGHQLKRW